MRVAQHTILRTGCEQLLRILPLKRPYLVRSNPPSAHNRKKSLILAQAHHTDTVLCDGGGSTNGRGQAVGIFDGAWRIHQRLERLRKVRHTKACLDRDSHTAGTGQKCQGQCVITTTCTESQNVIRHHAALNRRDTALLDTPPHWPHCLRPFGPPMRELMLCTMPLESFTSLLLGQSHQLPRST